MSHLLSILLMSFSLTITPPTMMGDNAVVKPCTLPSSVNIVQSQQMEVNVEKTQEEEKEEEVQEPVSDHLYSLADLRFNGVIHWSGYKFTYYSEKVLPGGGLRIPGRHINDDGYVADGDGYIVLANDSPKGTIIPTPFGRYGKVYDRGTKGNHFDVYTS